MPKYPLTSDQDDQRPGLKPPQIGLGTFLWLFAVLAVPMFAMRAGGPLMAAAVVLFATAITAHVVGNALGTRLRDQGRVSRRDKSATGDVVVAQAHHFAPTTELSHRRKQLSWLLLALSTAGAIAGAVMGGILLSRVNAERMTGASLALAVGSCGVLGGLCGFVLVSFAKVFLQAWWQAHRDS